MKNKKLLIATLAISLVTSACCWRHGHHHDYNARFAEAGTQVSANL